MAALRVGFEGRTAKLVVVVPWGSRSNDEFGGPNLVAVSDRLHNDHFGG